MKVAMRLKDDTVCLTGIRPELLFGLTVANDVYASLGVELVITSANDARHSTTSLHYAGCAVELGTRNIPGDPATVAADLKSRLNVDYDVIFEGDHIHLEWQPRRR